MLGPWIREGKKRDSNSPEKGKREAGEGKRKLRES